MAALQPNAAVFGKSPRIKTNLDNDVNGRHLEAY